MTFAVKLVQLALPARLPVLYMVGMNVFDLTTYSRVGPPLSCRLSNRTSSTTTRFFFLSIFTIAQRNVESYFARSLPGSALCRSLDETTLYSTLLSIILPLEDTFCSLLSLPLLLFFELFWKIGPYLHQVSTSIAFVNL